MGGGPSAGSVPFGGGEPADVTDPALETVRPGQPTPGAVGRVGPGAHEGLADPTGTGRRQRHELWMRRALEVAVTGPARPDAATEPSGTTTYRSARCSTARTAPSWRSAATNAS